MANRPKLTPKRMAEIEVHLRAGLWRHNAAELVGIAGRTFEIWMKKGVAELTDADDVFERTGTAPPLGRHAKFAAMVIAIEAQTEAEMVGAIVRLTQSDNPEMQFKAAAWWLERKRNLVYGKGALRPELHPEGATEESDEDVLEAVLDKLANAEDNVIRLTGASGGRDGSG